MDAGASVSTGISKSAGQYHLGAFKSRVPFAWRFGQPGGHDHLFLRGDGAQQSGLLQLSMANGSGRRGMVWGEDARHGRSGGSACRSSTVYFSKRPFSDDPAERIFCIRDYEEHRKYHMG